MIPWRASNHTQHRLASPKSRRESVVFRADYPVLYSGHVAHDLRGLGRSSTSFPPLSSVAFGHSARWVGLRPPYRAWQPPRLAPSAPDFPALGRGLTGGSSDPNVSPCPYTAHTNAMRCSGPCRGPSAPKAGKSGAYGYDGGGLCPTDKWPSPCGRQRAICRRLPTRACSPGPGGYRLVADPPPLTARIRCANPPCGQRHPPTNSTTEHIYGQST